MRAAGIDFGEQRIGVAVTATGTDLSLPLTTIQRTSDRQALTALAELLMAREIEHLFVGEPCPPFGTGRHPRAARIRRFGRRLAARIGVPVTFVDERWTTVEAQELLDGAARRRKPGALDALAAQAILKSGLEQLRIQQISKEKP